MPFDIEKTSFEKLRRAVDFINDAGDETLDAASISVTAFNAKTGIDTSGTVISAAPAPSVPPGTKEVRFYVEAGTHGQTHKITVKVNTSGGTQGFEQSVYLRINDN